MGSVNPNGVMSMKESLTALTAGVNTTFSSLFVATLMEDSSQTLDAIWWRLTRDPDIRSMVLSTSWRSLRLLCNSFRSSEVMQKDTAEIEDVFLDLSIISQGSRVKSTLACRFTDRSTCSRSQWLGRGMFSLSACSETLATDADPVLQHFDPELSSAWCSDTSYESSQLLVSLVFTNSLCGGRVSVVHRIYLLYVPHGLLATETDASLDLLFDRGRCCGRLIFLGRHLTQLQEE